MDVMDVRVRAAGAPFVQPPPPAVAFAPPLADTVGVNDAKDGRRTIAHGALLVTIGMLLSAWLPASAGAAGKPYIVVYKTASAAASRAATTEISHEEGVTPTQRFGTAVRGF